MHDGPSNRDYEQPRFSVVFATRNRSTQLKNTLTAYCALDMCGLTWELIVIDNDSSDGTPAVLAAAARHLPLRTLHVSEPGQNSARNAAITTLRGALVVFTDDDVLPDPDCLQAYHAAAARWPDDIIFGARIDPLFPADTPAWMQDPAFEFSTTAFARYAPGEAEGRVKRHPYGPSFMVRRTSIGDLRFATHLGPTEGCYAMGGEHDFLRRLADGRYGYVYVPAARVRHVVRPEQIRAEWLLSRAEKKGRGQVYISSAENRRRIFVLGVSLKLWLATLRAALRYHLLSRIGGARRCIELGIRYRLRLGQVRELRQQYRTRTATRG